jgi:membrane fusion protein, multidrug efflux system
VDGAIVSNGTDKYMRKIRWVFFVVVALLVLAVYVLVNSQGQQKEQANDQEAVISATQVMETSFQPQISVVGTFVANQGVTIKSEAQGRITKVNFTSGQMVNEGDELVIIENTMQLGALQYAQAQYDLSQVTYKRNLNIIDKGAVSVAALDEAKANLDADKANVLQAQGDYDKTIIKASFSGRLGLRNVDVGDYLNAGDALVTLQNTDPMYVDFYVPQKYLPQLSMNEKVQVYPNTIEGQGIEGNVLSFETVINSDTGMIEVRAQVPNQDKTILPGGFATVTLFMGDATTALTVPQTALIYEAQGAYVYKLNGKKAQKQGVILGQQVGEAIEVTSGLSSEDSVVSAGTNKIHEGSVVIIANEPQEKSK